MQLGKYMCAVEGTPPGRKTKIWAIQSLSSSDTLGTVSWFGRWRQYCFRPEPNTTFNGECLNALTAFLRTQNQEHRNVADCCADLRHVNPVTTWP